MTLWRVLGILRLSLWYLSGPREWGSRPCFLLFKTIVRELRAVLFSHVNSLPPRGLQHARLPCPSPTSRACSNSYPSSQGCHPTISSFVVTFSSCLQSFPASGLFQGVSSSHQVAKVLELHLQHQSFQQIFRVWFPLGLTDLISLQSKGLKNLLQHRNSKASILRCSAFFMVQLSSYMTTEKTTLLTIQTFVSDVSVF